MYQHAGGPHAPATAGDNADDGIHGRRNHSYISQPSAAGAQGGGSDWDVTAEMQSLEWLHTAQLNSAMNELASAALSRYHKIALFFITILTVLVGSKGLASLGQADASAFDIIIGVCEVALGVFAALVTNFEWKARARSHNKRALGFSMLAMHIRAQMVLQPRERSPKVDFFNVIASRVAQLDELAEPLPVKLRLKAMKSMGIAHMWGAPPPAAGGSGPAGGTGAGARSAGGAGMGVGVGALAPQRENVLFPPSYYAPQMNQEGDIHLVMTQSM